MAWNIPLPAGAAGASSQTLAAAGQNLGQMMQPRGLPDVNTLAGMGGYGDGARLLDPWLQFQYWQEEGINTRFTAQDQRLLYQFDKNLEWIQEEAAMQYKQAIAIAEMYSGADYAYAGAVVEQAMIQAQAAVEAANIAAAAQRYDSDTKLKIAKMATDLERQRIGAIELSRPGDWIARTGFFRGQTPEQSQALQQYGGGTVFTPQAATQLPQLPAAESAIVGEAGPELAQATPQGMQISPLQAEQARHLRGQGVQGMARGGTLSYSQLPNPRTVTGRSMMTMADVSGTRRKSPTEMRTAQWSRETARKKLMTQGPAALSGRQFTTLAQGRAPTAAEWQPYGVPAQRTNPFAQALTSGTSGGASLPSITGTGDLNGGTTGDVSPVDQLPFLQFARAGGQLPVPSFQEWTGPRTNPAAGINEPIPPPWNYNIVQFQNMARPEQAMLAAAWRSMGMIAGQTEEEMVANAMEAMSRSAWRGAALPMVAYGGR